VIFTLYKISRPSLGPNQTPIQWVLDFPYPGLKRQECEGGHSPLSSAKVKSDWSYTSFLPACICGVDMDIAFTFICLHIFISTTT
jgi:hypothetical protein